jgi:hypothetical protein
MFSDINNVVQIGLSRRKNKKVPIVTGSPALPDYDTPSPLRSMLRIQRDLFKVSNGAWLDLRIRLEIAELNAMFTLERNSRHFRDSPHRAAVDRFFSSASSLDVPELTEVAPTTFLSDEGIDFDTVSAWKVCADHHHRKHHLDECECVFLSTTLLRDLSELELVASQLKRPDNKVIVGVR